MPAILAGKSDNMTGKLSITLNESYNASNIKAGNLHCKDRHVPGSQPPFSLSPDTDQDNEDTPFISVVACTFLL